MSEFAAHPTSLTVARLACRVGFKLYFASCPVNGLEALPKQDQSYILALNHPSAVDIGLVWSYFPDAIYFPFQKGVDGSPLVQWAREKIQDLGEDPRDTSLRFLKERKRNIGIFVDGPGVTPGGSLEAAWLAARTGVPVVPGFISGMDRALPPGAIIPSYTRNISIRVGTPVAVRFSSGDPGPDEIEAQTRLIQSAVARLGEGPASPAPKGEGGS